MSDSKPAKQDILNIFQEVLLMLNDVSSNNDHTIKQTDKLKIVLLNLKIQSAHINQPNGISPIAIELSKITDLLHEKTKEVTTNRQKLIEYLTIIQDYIKNSID